MNRILMAMAMTVAAATLSTPASAQISVNIGQPGFYGRIDIGGFPPPPLLFPEPRMIHRVPASRPPLYLRVPPNHARDWRRYCRQYGACGERVYFVQDNWYRDEYAPRYQERHGHRDQGRYEQRDNHRRDDQRGRGRGDDRGDDPGNSRGHGYKHND